MCLVTGVIVPPPAATTKIMSIFLAFSKKKVVGMRSPLGKLVWRHAAVVTVSALCGVSHSVCRLRPRSMYVSNNIIMSGRTMPLACICQRPKLHYRNTKSLVRKPEPSRTLAMSTVMVTRRRYSETTAALLSSLEVPLAPLFTFLVLAEVPAVATLCGGAIVLCGVLWATTRSALSERSRRTRTPPRNNKSRPVGRLF